MQISAYVTESMQMQNHADYVMGSTRSYSKKSLCILWPNLHPIASHISMGNCPFFKAFTPLSSTPTSNIPSPLRHPTPRPTLGAEGLWAFHHP